MAPRSDLITVRTCLRSLSLFFLHLPLCQGVCSKWQHQFTWTSLACNGRITLQPPHPVPIIGDRGHLSPPCSWLKAFMPIMGNSLSRLMTPTTLDFSPGWPWWPNCLRSPSLYGCSLPFGSTELRRICISLCGISVFQWNTHSWSLLCIFIMDMCVIVLPYIVCNNYNLSFWRDWASEYSNVWISRYL